MYSFSWLNFGFKSLFTIFPSFVSRRSPVEFLSNLPTAESFSVKGSREEASLSFFVGFSETKPLGLLSATTILFLSSFFTISLILTLSFIGSIFWPIIAFFLFTDIRPCLIKISASLLEQIFFSYKNLFNLINGLFGLWEISSWKSLLNLFER